MDLQTNDILTAEVGRRIFDAVLTLDEDALRASIEAELREDYERRLDEESSRLRAEAEDRDAALAGERGDGAGAPEAGGPSRRVRTLRDESGASDGSRCAPAQPVPKLEPMQSAGPTTPTPPDSGRRCASHC